MLIILFLGDECVSLFIVLCLVVDLIAWGSVRWIWWWYLFLFLVDCWIGLGV